MSKKHLQLDKLGRAFAPYIPIGEAEYLQLSYRQDHAIFLKRNLSYAARVHETSAPTNCIRLTLQSITPIPSTSSIKNKDVIIFVSVCAITRNAVNDISYIPLATKPVLIPLENQSTTCGIMDDESPAIDLTFDEDDGTVDVIFPISLPADTMCDDMAILLIYTPENEVMHSILDFKSKALHRSFENIVHCPCISSEITPDKIFNWLDTKAPMLYSAIHLCSSLPMGDQEKGLRELQWGTLHVHSAHDMINTPPVSTPASTSIPSTSKQGQQQQHSPMLITPQPIGVPRAYASIPLFMFRWSLGIDGPMELDSLKRKHNKKNKRNTSKYSRAEVLVHFCSADGTQRATTVFESCICPFDLCNMACRDVTGMLQHIKACHHYYEAVGMYDENSGRTPEIFIRCKKEWFSSNGLFLPLELASEIPQDHTLHQLLIQTPIWMPFYYYCPPQQRQLRDITYATSPVDDREFELEKETADEMNSDADWFFNIPIENKEEGDDDDDSDGTIAKGLIGKERKNMAGHERNKKTRPVQGTSLDTDTISTDTGRKEDVLETKKDPSARTKRKTSANIPKRNPSQPVCGLQEYTKNGSLKFYHSGNAMPLTRDELFNGGNSDEESDFEEWTRDFHLSVRDRGLRLSEEEQGFMLRWNIFTRQNVIYSDSGVASMCKKFAHAYADEISRVDGSFRRCFTVHLTNLWRFRLLSPEDLRDVLMNK